jgi:hypothetical protein
MRLHGPRDEKAVTRPNQSELGVGPYEQTVDRVHSALGLR